MRGNIDYEVIELLLKYVPYASRPYLVQQYSQLPPAIKKRLLSFARKGISLSYQQVNGILDKYFPRAEKERTYDEEKNDRLSDFQIEALKRRYGKKPANWVWNEKTKQFEEASQSEVPDSPQAMEPKNLRAPPGSSTETMIATASATARSAPGSTMMGTGHGETAISPVTSVIKQPWPSTVTCMHHYYDLHGNTSITDTAVGKWSYRLNSIYDCRDTGTYLDNDAPTVPTTDVVDATINTPTWRTYWSTYYNYWTVLSSKYRMRFKVTPADLTTKDVELMVYVYHHGVQNPPLYADGTATGTGTTLVTHQFRRQHRGMYYFPIRYKPETGFNNVDQFEINSCSGEWSPGSIPHEVQEDELQQIWHRISEVPPTREGLTVIIQKSPTNAYAGTVVVTPEISIEYTVQWKDLKRIYQYPTQITSVPAITNAGAQSAT
jgi:hypothetical protein